MSVRVPPDRILFGVWGSLVPFLNALESTNPGPSLYVSSWYRDLATNRRWKGDEKSSHLVGLAVDVDGYSSELNDFLWQCRDAGLVAIYHKGHVHVQALEAYGAYARFPNLFP